MPYENPRSQRVADQIQRELAVLLQREIKDPRIGMVTITSVNVTRDLDHASVYFTVLPAANAAKSSEEPVAEEAGEPQQDAAQQTLAGLQKAAGFLRRELSRRLKLRNTPTLHFVYDKSITEGNRLASLIELANSDNSNDAPDAD